MNTDSTTLYKLMILYMLSKVNFPLSNVQISTFMLDNEYTSYFTFQETINSLVEDSFIQQMNYRIFRCWIFREILAEAPILLLL